MASKLTTNLRQVITPSLRFYEERYPRPQLWRMQLDIDILGKEI